MKIPSHLNRQGDFSQCGVPIPHTIVRDVTELTIAPELPHATELPYATVHPYTTVPPYTTVHLYATALLNEALAIQRK